MKERINYTKDGKYYVGVPVNIQGVVVQAESLEDLKIKSKTLCKIALEHMLSIINQEDCFEMVEIETHFKK